MTEQVENIDEPLERDSGPQCVLSDPVMAEKVKYAQSLGKNRRFQVPQELIDLLERKKDFNSNKEESKEELVEGQIVIDRPEGQDDVQENDEDPAMGQASHDDLVDGQVSKLPATNVDQLFAARRIKKVG